MTDPSLPADDLAALRRRWESGSTPQLAIQLAEAHKRRSEPQRAVEVLEKALAENPSHLAVRVAAGRLRWELGDLAGAAAELEQVVERDPTHLVANKLLVRVYAGLSQPSRARDRLDLYRLLNESDPEIGELEALLPPVEAVEVETGAAAAAGSPPAQEEGAEAEPRAGGADRAAASEATPAAGSQAPPAAPDEPFGAPAAARGAAGTRGREAPPVGASAAAAQADGGSRAADTGQLPFPGLWDDLDRDGYRRQIDGEIFADAATPPAAAPSSAAQTEPEAVVREPEAAADPEPVETEPQAEPVPVETAPQAEAEVAGTTPPSDPERGRSRRPGPGPIEVVLPERRERRADDEQRRTAASVTLAALYHQQGHLEEARRTYHEVLGREPSNREALGGLARLSRSQPDELTAFDLLAAGYPADPRERQRRLLEGYLDRLRGREATGV